MRSFGNKRQDHILYAFGFPSKPGILKIGYSSRGAIYRKNSVTLPRVTEQTTGYPEKPVVHLVIHSWRAEAFERMAHKALPAVASGGREWFRASAEDVIHVLGGEKEINKTRNEKKTEREIEEKRRRDSALKDFQERLREQTLLTMEAKFRHQFLRRLQAVENQIGWAERKGIWGASATNLRELKASFGVKYKTVNEAWTNLCIMPRETLHKIGSVRDQRLLASSADEIRKILAEIDGHLNHELRLISPFEQLSTVFNFIERERSFREFDPSKIRREAISWRRYCKEIHEESINLCEEMFSLKMSESERAHLIKERLVCCRVYRKMAQ